jgi:orotate phosphoribosyltransferase
MIFDLLAGRFSNSQVNKVIGIEESGSVLAFGTAQRLGANVAIGARNSNGIHLMRGFALSPGERVLVVDDVTTTGGTIWKMLDLVRQEGAQPAGIGLVATKGPLADDFGVPIEVLVELEGMETHLPQDCPLCKKNVPLT